MNFVEIKDAGEAKEVDKSVKNRWNWAWLERKPYLFTLHHIIKKIRSPGEAYCILCRAVLKYGSRGAKALEQHCLNNEHHRQAEKNKKECRPLPYAGCHPMFKNVSQNKQEELQEELPKPLTCVADRVINAECKVLGFLVENSLPFSLTPKIISLSKELAKDSKALDGLHMDRTSASYKTKFGVGKTFQEQLIAELQKSSFSLNIDEASSNNLLHVLTILVSYYSEELKRVAVFHLSSSSVIKVDSASILSIIESLFQEHVLPWKNLISILSDSCNVMRGCKNGVETKIRKDLAPHLLDVDGDTAHHAHNASKKISEAFDRYAEELFNTIYNDFKWSTDLRDMLHEICDILGISFTMPAQYVSTRWLSVYQVAIDCLRLFDAYTVFYYAFLPKDDRVVYLNVNVEILHRLNVSSKAKDRIRILQQVMQKKNMTADGKKRKQNICEKLFYQRKKLLLILHFYSCVFPQLQKYVKLFQRQEPQIHKLHDEIMQLIKEFLSNFLKPEVLSSNPKKLAKIDMDEGQWLKDKDVFIGNKASVILATFRSDDSTRVDFMNRVKTAYTLCGKYLLNKMPMMNQFLQCASAIDPALISSHNSSVLVALKKLPTMLSTVLSEEELDDYDQECRSYVLDTNLPIFEEKMRIDDYWARVFEIGKYPNLSKIVKSVMCCFHGPQVESSFSIMANTLTAERSRLNIKTYDALQTVRYQLMAVDKSSVEYFSKNDPIHDQIDPLMKKNMKSAYHMYTKEQEKVHLEKQNQQNELDLKKQKALSKKKALEATELAQKKARKAHRLAMLVAMTKRKREINSQRYPSLATPASVNIDISVEKGKQRKRQESNDSGSGHLSKKRKKEQKSNTGNPRLEERDDIRVSKKKKKKELRRSHTSSSRIECA